MCHHIDIEFRGRDHTSLELAAGDRIIGERELFEFGAQMFFRHSRGNKRANGHVAADTGKAIEISNPHSAKIRCYELSFRARYLLKSQSNLNENPPLSTNALVRHG